MEWNVLTTAEGYMSEFEKIHRSEGYKQQRLTRCLKSFINQQKLWER